MECNMNVHCINHQNQVCVWTWWYCQSCLKLVKTFIKRIEISKDFTLFAEDDFCNFFIEELQAWFHKKYAPNSKYRTSRAAWQIDYISLILIEISGLSMMSLIIGGGENTDTIKKATFAVWCWTWLKFYPKTSFSIQNFDNGNSLGMLEFLSCCMRTNYSNTVFEMDLETFVPIWIKMTL